MGFLWVVLQLGLVPVVVTVLADCGQSRLLCGLVLLKGRSIVFRLTNLFHKLVQNDVGDKDGNADGDDGNADGDDGGNNDNSSGDNGVVMVVYYS